MSYLISPILRKSTIFFDHLENKKNEVYFLEIIVFDKRLSQHNNSKSRFTYSYLNYLGCRFA